MRKMAQLADAVDADAEVDILSEQESPSVRCSPFGFLGTFPPEIRKVIYNIYFVDCLAKGYELYKKKYHRTIEPG